ncbi:hypothetical protein [Streptomyces prasinus]
MNSITADDSSVIAGLRRFLGTGNVSAARARKAVQELVTITDDGEAMALA